MQDDDKNEHNRENHHYYSDTEIVGGARVSLSDLLSGPQENKAGKKTATFIIPETSNDNGGTILSNDDIVEITLDIGDDSAAIHSVKITGGEDVTDSEFDKRTSLIGNASSRFKKVSKEVKRLTSFTKRPLNEEFKTSSNALEGLRFISKADGDTGWGSVEKRFDELTKSSNGLLPRSLFGECIGCENSFDKKGMNKESKEFAQEIFDALARRHHIKGGLINKPQLRDCWEQISDQSFDTRLQTFFDMIDKDGDGRIRKAEIRNIITLSASANKLSFTEKQVNEYAALILEELDPDNLGCLMIENMEMFLQQIPDNSARISDSENLSKMQNQKLMRTQSLNSIRRYHEDLKDFMMDNYQRVWVPLYAGKRLIRAFRLSDNSVKILKVAVYPGNVLALHMSKPQGFKYKSGQYVFVNCATVSSFEWHPFSITSSPHDDYISVHIKTFGDWTENIISVFSKACQMPPSEKRFLGENYPKFPRVLIDGPYGTLAQDYKKYEVVLLIGLDIGVTPMISIIKDIFNNMKWNKDEENVLEHGMGSSSMQLSESKSRKKSTFKTKKAYFYWSTREQGSYAWFHNIMDEIAEAGLEEVLDIHNYCTSVYQEGDVRSAILTMLQSFNYTKNGVDVISGTRVKTHFGRPNWRNIYQNIANNHPDSKVGVFYSADRVLTEELRKLALNFTHSGSTRFDFHKENF